MCLVRVIATRMLEILRYGRISYHSDCTMILIDFNILQKKFANRTLKHFIKAQRNVNSGNRTNGTLQEQGVSNNCQQGNRAKKRG